MAKTKTGKKRERDQRDELPDREGCSNSQAGGPPRAFLGSGPEGAFLRSVVM
jgi:hypothetical protein